MRWVFASVVLILVALGVVTVFWYQEAQYLLPTPVPAGYHAVTPNEVIHFDSSAVNLPAGRSKLLHFFNPHCPCSKFNLKHFQTLRKTYAADVDFLVVIREAQDTAAARALIGPEVKLVVDDHGVLAKRCGVYSTPQAAIVQADDKLYFRGNYNRSRYCTRKESNFVQMALDSMIQHRATPHFIELATQSYGCSISQSSSLFQ